MNEPMRPMSLGEILDRTFQIYRSKFLLFVTLAAMPALAMMALRFVNHLWWRLAPTLLADRKIDFISTRYLLYSLALYHISLLLHTLTWPAYADLTSRLNFGEEPKLFPAILWCVARWRRWFWLTISNWGAVLVLPEVAVAAILLGFLYLLSQVIMVGPKAMGVLTPLIICSGFALCFQGVLQIAARLSLAIPAWTLEDLSVGKALRRGWTLSKGREGRILFARILPAFGGILLCFLLTVILITVFATMTGTHRELSYHSISNILAGIVFFSEAVASTLIGPIFPIALTLIYYDQRIRHEGYDIERMMDAAGLGAPKTGPDEQSTIAPAGAGESQD
jgi:hypothetical protein